MSQYPKILSWVKYLETTEKPSFGLNDVNLGEIRVNLRENLNAEDYLDLYKEVGRHYIWNYRPSQTLEEVQEIISSPNTRVYYFFDSEKAIGFSEVDLSDSQNIEIVHFGLIDNYTQKGFGKEIFKYLLLDLWNLNPDRIFLSTCGLDHHKAVSFYQKAGFEIFKEKEDVEFEDYRYSDFYDLSDAPQIPLAKEA